jgi:nucleotide-binding universal stress UspA family protein
VQTTSYSGDEDIAVLAAKRIFTRIFVPVDFTLASHAAFATAVELQRAHGSALRIFHAVQASASTEWLGGIGSPAVIEGDWIARAHDRLRRFVENIAPEALDRVEVEARIPGTADLVSIVRAAASEWSATLLIASAQVHRRFFLRSSAERLVHDSELPALIIPARRVA